MVLDFWKTLYGPIFQLLIFENSGNAVALTYGGDYRLAYCTMANFGNTDEALLMNDFYCSDPLCSAGAQLNKLTARIDNCILVGSSSDEIWINDAAAPGAGLVDVFMRNNIVMVDELDDADQYPDFFTNLCINCIQFRQQDTLFENLQMNDYHLDSLSIAEKKAIPLPDITDDLEANPRDPLMPDIGCYEYKQ